ncbi:hypothetical protein TcWFU_010097 [Taenia crassiceps]|uniref:Uncharacterized protein n=1 Tax=Taenia crassiceps TaxID=6207 RepID=A0ABR4QU43_9CEST
MATPSTEAASVMAAAAAERAKSQPEGLTPAVWKSAAKAVAKKVGRAITKFAIYEAAEKAVVGAYNKASKWIKRRFNRYLGLHDG